MTSSLTPQQFELRLSKLTVKGPSWFMSSPFAILTIFNDMNKPFYGEFDKTQFQLTRNSIMPFSNTYYSISGHYLSNETGVTVSCEIKPLRFHYYATRIVAILLFAVVNTAIFLSDEVTLQSFAFSNLMVGILLFIRFKIESLCKNRLEIRFQEEFRLKP